VPGLLVASGGSEEVFDDPKFQRGAVRVARIDGGFRLLEIFVDLRVGARIRLERAGQALPRLGSRRAVAGVLLPFEESCEQERIRRRGLESRLDARDGPGTAAGNLLGEEPCGAPSREQVLGVGRSRFLVCLDRGRNVLRLFFENTLQRRDARVARRESRRLREQAPRARQVLRAHRGDGSIGPTQGVLRSQTAHRFKPPQSLRELTLLERGQPDVLFGLETLPVAR
jgi:hypothetical protein